MAKIDLFCSHLYSVFSFLSQVKINSNGLVYNAVLLFLTVGVAVGGLKSTGWKVRDFLSLLFTSAEF